MSKIATWITTKSKDVLWLRDKILSIFRLFCKKKKEKRFIASYFLSVLSTFRLSEWNKAPKGRIFMKFDIWLFFKNCREDRSFIKI
jgi:hypothetical protein